LLPRATTLAQPTPASSSPLCAPLCLSSTLAAYLSKLSHGKTQAAHCTQQHPIALRPFERLWTKERNSRLSLRSRTKSRLRFSFPRTEAPLHTPPHMYVLCVLCARTRVCLRALSGCVNSINAPKFNQCPEAERRPHTAHISAHRRSFSSFSSIKRLDRLKTILFASSVLSKPPSSCSQQRRPKDKTGKAVPPTPHH
jgi:hypothetical protein